MDLPDPDTARPLLLSRNHMVSAGHPLAAQAGLKVLEAGGNAVDAGVASGFALNVVQPDMANLGGIAPILIHVAGKDTTTAIAGVGTWPRSAKRDELKKIGRGKIPATPARWVVPAAVDAWLTALRLFGTMKLAEVLEPAIELAERGFPANYFIASNVTAARHLLLRQSGTRMAFFRNDMGPAIGDLVVQEELGQTFRILLEAERQAGSTRETGIQAARDAFYKGDIARTIDNFARETDAFLRLDDLATYHVHVEPALEGSYRGRRVFSCGPWCQGPTLLQVLNLFEGFRLDSMAEAERIHVMVECVKLALRDRNMFYGDPDFVNVPIKELISKSHAHDLRRLVDGSRARTDNPSPSKGRPSFDTTYAAVVDREGNAFSATPSDSTLLVTPMVPKLGFAISDRGLQSSLDPGDPNAIAPGKRPRATPNPSILLDDDGILAFGTPGGDVQVQAMAQFLVNHIDLGLDMQAATEMPRWASYDVPATEDPHPSDPQALFLEEDLAARSGSALRDKGHSIKVWPRRAALAGGVCAVRRSRGSGVLSGAADPRRMSYAVGW